ncbi:hypothetical protein ABLB84_09245 [Xenorhabdus szentirmaii]|nr:hypothetical protein [Xenorhabdus sp. ZM]MBD2806979.1 hypothetical protein [Xenorhabdus sp. ZM]
MTEKEEKAERRALMREHQCSELESAKLVARKMDIVRGLWPDLSIDAGRIRR